MIFKARPLVTYRATDKGVRCLLCEAITIDLACVNAERCQHCGAPHAILPHIYNHQKLTRRLFAAGLTLVAFNIGCAVIALFLETGGLQYAIVLLNVAVAAINWTRSKQLLALTTKEKILFRRLRDLARAQRKESP